ncbi:MAG: 30S ribosomal protein S17 [Phycisphaerae bacterium]|nr:30S ribosomal protein S17 [Phycisphaerae bacterium]
MAQPGEIAPTGRRSVRVGVVSSTGGDKTIRVVVHSLVKHPMYGKIRRRTTKVAVHDPQNAAGLGDVVEIAACRRMSKSKSWRLLRVIRKGTAVPEALAGEG